LSRGSVSELETQLIIATELGLVQKANADRVAGMLDEERRMLAGLQRSLKAKLRNSS
jgi:four helix bundle protein